MLTLSWITISMNGVLTVLVFSWLRTSHGHCGLQAVRQLLMMMMMMMMMMMID